MSDLTFGLLSIHIGGLLGTIVAARWRMVPLFRAFVLSILFMGGSMLSPWSLSIVRGSLWDDLAFGAAIGAIVALIAGRLLAVPLWSAIMIITLCGAGMVIGGVLAS